VKDTLSVCAIFKDEAENLDEWLTFHSYVGVDRFYLFDDGSTDNFSEVLEPWVLAGRVKLFSAHGRKQKKVYNYCLRRARFKTMWLAFIDIDEFLFAPNDQDLVQVLDEFRGCAGVLVRWVLFGSSGHFERPSTSVIKSFTRSAGPEIDVDFEVEYKFRRAVPNAKVTATTYQGKSILNPRRVLHMKIHSPKFWLGNLVNESGSIFKRSQKSSFARMNYFKNTPVKKLRINHYWSRSLSELTSKVRRRVEGSFHRGEDIDFDKTLERYLEREASLNLVEDLSIQKVWERARSRRESNFELGPQPK
jgi:hypothetical protein